MFHIVNLVTNHIWTTNVNAEARLYAEMTNAYSVFRHGGSGCPISTFDIY